MQISSKLPVHLHIQHSLQKMLAPHEVWLEKRFVNIGRIADVVWPAKKLIFEVQVSPISAEEIRARNRDYAREGYQVIWILHDKHFNRFHLTPAEITLRFSPHYFTNITTSGRVMFYDQISWIKRKRRINRSPRFPVNFKRVSPIDKQIPRQFPLERKKWSLTFEGDVFHHPSSLPKGKKIISSQLLTHPIKVIWHLLLEKTCL